MSAYERVAAARAELKALGSRGEFAARAADAEADRLGRWRARQAADAVWARALGRLEAALEAAEGIMDDADHGDDGACERCSDF